MTIPESLRTIAQLDMRLETIFAARDALNEKIMALRAQRDVAVAARFAELSDEVILTDEAIRKWALDNETYDSGTYQRMRALAEPKVSEIVIHGCDGREGFEKLLRPTVILERDSDVAAVADELVRWETVWGMGREDIPVDILESTLSAYGSYAIVWRPGVREGGEQAAELHHRYSMVCGGSLYQVLEYVAKHHPYNHGRDAED